jgi:hypothetical protein
VDAKKAISDAKLAELALIRLSGKRDTLEDRVDRWIKLELGNF